MSTDESTNLKRTWIQLKVLDHCSDSSYFPAQIIALNCHEFVVIQARRTDEDIKICAYDAATNLIENKDELAYFIMIYVDDINCTFLHSINLKTENTTTVGPKLKFSSDSIEHLHFVNGEIHGINHGGKHWAVYNDKLSILKKLDGRNLSHSAESIYIRSQQSILLIGGPVNGNVILSLATQKCRKIQHLEFRAYGFGATLTSNEGYIVWMGGRVFNRSHDNNLDDIYVLDIRDEDESKWKLKKSSIKCPKVGVCKAVRTGGIDSKDEILVIGFIKDCFKQKEFDNLQLPPSNILKMIAEWYDAEMIHLVA